MLGSNADLFHAPLTELFDALREEAAFSVEDKALNMDDDGGTLEWVLEHENEGVALVIGEVSPPSSCLAIVQSELTSPHPASLLLHYRIIATLPSFPFRTSPSCTLTADWARRCDSD